MVCALVTVRTRSNHLEMFADGLFTGATCAGSVSWRIKYYTISTYPTVTMIIFKSAQGAKLAQMLAGDMFDASEVQFYLQSCDDVQHPSCFSAETEWG